MAFSLKTIFMLQQIPRVNLETKEDGNRASKLDLKDLKQRTELYNKLAFPDHI